MARYLLFVLIVAVASLRVEAREVLAGPIDAEVLRVVDGDTIKVRAHIWVDQHVEVSVRFADVDAPELYRPRCEAEKAQARAARDLVQAVAGDRIRLRNVTLGKYAGRVVAAAETLGGEDLGQTLLRHGLAVRENDAAPWCAGA
ncbi:MAG: thermonuclease family protein [Pseudomonadota bacterium]